MQYRSDITSKVRIELSVLDILRRDFNKIEGGPFEDKKIFESLSAEKKWKGPFSLICFCMLRLKNKNWKEDPLR